jgi:hypothetical protein
VDPPVDVSTLRELYTTPPAQFVAARNQLVKERRAAKDRDGATALGQLRKPALADWALNVVAARHGGDVAAFLDAAGTVRDAQAAAIEGRDGPDIRAALRDLRDHSGQVLGRAQEVLADAGRDAATEAGVVASRLTEISASDEASAQLAAGVLGSSGFTAADLFGELEPAARAAPRRAPPKQRTAPPAATTKARTEHQQALTRATRARDAAAKDLARADAAVDKAAAAVRNVERRLEQARDGLETAERDRDAATRRLADADKAVGAAERALHRATR